MIILKKEGSPPLRRIPVAEAADLIGKRFYADWCATDPAMLKFDADTAPDKEAWHRAEHVERMLCRYVTEGHVTAFALTDDGTATTDLPLHWVTDPAFTICLHNGTCRIQMDRWEPLWIDLRELTALLPKVGQPRQKHSFEWDKIVNEAWKFALSQDVIPRKAEVVRHLGDWCPANRQEVPDGSHLSKVAKTVIDFLNENKSRWQNFKSESCEDQANTGE